MELSHPWNITRAGRAGAPRRIDRNNVSSLERNLYACRHRRGRQARTCSRGRNSRSQASPLPNQANERSRRRPSVEIEVWPGCGCGALASQAKWGTLARGGRAPAAVGSDASSTNGCNQHPARRAGCLLGFGSVAAGLAAARPDQGEGLGVFVVEEIGVDRSVEARIVELH